MAEQGPKITDLSGETPTGAPAYERTTPRRKTKIHADGKVSPDGRLRGTIEVHTESPAIDPATTALTRSLSYAVGLGLLPAGGTAALCIYAHAWAWVTILLPLLVCTGATYALVKCMRQRE